MKGKKDGSVSNERTYKDLNEKLQRNQTFFKELAKETQKVSKSNREHIQRMEEKSPSFGPQKG